MATVRCLDQFGATGPDVVKRVGLVVGGFGKLWRISELPRIGGADLG